MAVKPVERIISWKKGEAQIVLGLSVAEAEMVLGLILKHHRIGTDEQRLIRILREGLEMIDLFAGRRDGLNITRG